MLLFGAWMQYISLFPTSSQEQAFNLTRGNSPGWRWEEFANKYPTVRILLHLSQLAANSRAADDISALSAWLIKLLTVTLKAVLGFRVGIKASGTLGSSDLLPV